MSDAALVTMRLVDMHRYHPAQDNSKVCSACGERVGIYPSGQEALRKHPGMKIICTHCLGRRPGDVAVLAAPIEDIARESRESKDVGKA
jgi:hypothetical protein